MENWTAVSTYIFRFYIELATIALRINFSIFTEFSELGTAYSGSFESDFIYQ